MGVATEQNSPFVKFDGLFLEFFTRQVINIKLFSTVSQNLLFLILVLSSLNFKIIVYNLYKALSRLSFRKFKYNISEIALRMNLMGVFQWALTSLPPSLPWELRVMALGRNKTGNLYYTQTQFRKGAIDFNFHWRTPIRILIELCNIAYVEPSIMKLVSKLVTLQEEKVVHSALWKRFSVNIFHQ